ncbi:hypothetical protein BGLA2_1950025 [Burkholderia gladioli]|nr:hypothetical protein BGLA2_1950025 [Burkholderia gladioli]
MPCRLHLVTTQISFLISTTRLREQTHSPEIAPRFALPDMRVDSESQMIGRNHIAVMPRR